VGHRLDTLASPPRLLGAAPLPFSSGPVIARVRSGAASLLALLLVLTSAGLGACGESETSGGYDHALVARVGQASTDLAQVFASGHLIPPEAPQFSAAQKATYARLLNGSSTISESDLHSLDAVDQRAIAQASRDLKQLRATAAELRGDIVSRPEGATAAVRGFVDGLNRITQIAQHENALSTKALELGVRLDRDVRAATRAIVAHQPGAHARMLALVKTGLQELAPVTEAQNQEGGLQEREKAATNALYSKAVDRDHPAVARFVADVEREYPTGVINDVIRPR